MTSASQKIISLTLAVPLAWISLSSVVVDHSLFELVSCVKECASRSLPVLLMLVKSTLNLRSCSLAVWLSSCKRWLFSLRLAISASRMTLSFFSWRQKDRWMNENEEKGRDVMNRHFLWWCRFMSVCHTVTLHWCLHLCSQYLCIVTLKVSVTTWYISGPVQTRPLSHDSPPTNVCGLIYFLTDKKTEEKPNRTKDSHSLQISVQLLQHDFQLVEPTRQIVGHLIPVNTHHNPLNKWCSTV